MSRLLRVHCLRTQIGSRSNWREEYMVPQMSAHAKKGLKRKSFPFMLDCSYQDHGWKKCGENHGFFSNTYCSGAKRKIPSSKMISLAGLTDTL